MFSIFCSDILQRGPGFFKDFLNFFSWNIFGVVLKMKKLLLKRWGVAVSLGLLCLLCFLDGLKDKLFDFFLFPSSRTETFVKKCYYLDEVIAF